MTSLGALALLLALVVPSLQSNLRFVCPDGWSLLHGRCLKAFSVHSPYEAAQDLCTAYGARLVSVFGFEKSLEVSSLVKPHVSEYWVESPHGPEGGYFAGDEPKLEDACLYIDTSHSGYQHQYYAPVPWRSAWCYEAKPFVCETSACLAGQMKCLGGGCVKHGRCDGEPDCPDATDEMDCPRLCRHHYKGQSTGKIVVPSPYRADMECRWVIEGPPGSRLSIDFNHFQTEAKRDFVEVWCGGLTEATSEHLASLSGDIDTSSLHTYYSNNNIMIVVFRSDGSVSDNGVSLTFNAAPQAAIMRTVELEAREDAQLVTSPNFPDFVMPAQQVTYVISAGDNPRRVITLRVVQMDMGPDASLAVHDGASPEARQLVVLTGSNRAGPPFVTSTGHRLTVFFSSGRKLFRGAGFSLLYKLGCNEEITADYGVLTSPGYPEPYPNYISCEMLVRTETPGRSLTIIVDDLDLSNVLGEDTFSIEEASGNVLLAETESPSSLPISLSSGPAFTASFTSSPTNARRGFKMRFSVDCMAPPDDGITVISPSSVPTKLGSVLVLSCPSGYVFQQQEHAGRATVSMTCDVGGWDVRQMPGCSPILCGRAPRVEHAYLVGNPDSGVVFGDTLQYACEQGYSMAGDELVDCLASGSWGPLPVCQPARCPARAQTLLNGQVEITSGDGTSFTTAMEYTCAAGYDVIGNATITCRADGTWSADPPSCVRRTCFLTAMPTAASYNPGQRVSLGESLVVTCKAGYRNAAGGSSQTVTCQSSGGDGEVDFNAVPICTNINECDNDPCGQLCADTDGSFTCSCEDGYTLATDLISCNDVPECAANNGGCSHGCQEQVPGYACTCLAGYALWEADNQLGQEPAPGQTGLERWAYPRDAHTCIAKACPSLSVPDNGRFLNQQNRYAIDSELKLLCDLGYELSGNDVLTCLDQPGDDWGTWDRTLGTCPPATCSPPSLTGLSYPPTVSPTGTIAYGASVTFDCSAYTAAAQPTTYTRQCVYDTARDEYRVGLDDNHDCRMDDCGTPDISLKVPGAVMVTQPPNTLRGATFQARCSGTMVSSVTPGLNSAADLTIECQATAWYYGALECSASRCPDPGTEPGTEQVVDDTQSWLEGQTQAYTCTRTGYELSDPVPLVCQPGAAGWDRSPPICTDAQDPVPVQAQGLCGTTLPIDYLSAPAFTLPFATDNTGIASVVVSPSSFKPNEERDEGVVVTYTFTDFAGNSATCVITIEINAYEPPEIICPDSYFVFVDSIAGQADHVPTTASATDADGNAIAVVYNPPSVAINAVGASTIVTATATDDFGLTDSCNFQVTIKASDCSLAHFADPRYAVVDCVQSGVGIDCTITADDGFLFYEVLGATEITDSCSRTGSGFTYKQVPQAIQPSNAQYTEDAQYLFDVQGDVNTAGQQGCLDNYKAQFNTGLVEMAVKMSQQCQDYLSDSNFASSLLVEAVTAETTVTVVVDQLEVTFSLSVLPHNLTLEVRKICADVARLSLRSTSQTPESLRALPASPQSGGCPAATAAGTDQGVLQYTFLRTEFYCPDDFKTYNAGDEVFCVPCPYGHRFVNGVCEKCPVGTYGDSNIPAEACFDCPPDTWSPYEGTAWVEGCLPTCNVIGRANTVTGVAPCHACPKGKYASDWKTCSDCPDGTTTVVHAASSLADCIPVCAAGTSSPTGTTSPSGCQPCPVNFYQDQAGQSTCIECNSGTKTSGPGSSTSGACIRVDNCDVNPCGNGGNCVLDPHGHHCVCAAGYTGSDCSVEIDACASSPCYYGHPCLRVGTDYTCDCPLDFPADSRCGVLPNACASAGCSGAAGCRDVYKNGGATVFECVCPESAGGTLCTDVIAICNQNPCGDGTCLTITDTASSCQCGPGFTGQFCENNIDECASNPCLYGGTCVDGDNGYTCQCGPHGGANCEARVSLCNGSPCGVTGSCHDYYPEEVYVCDCADYYLGDNQVAVDRGLTDLAACPGVSTEAVCTKVAFCDPDPCRNTAPCVEGVSGPVCSCPPGYTGKFCQTDIDDCAAQPCQHGATCVDAVNTYSCICVDGYTGDNCETDINECQDPSYPCSVEGTQTASGCDDRVNDYTCSCQPGYTGKDCETNVDECASDPCRHDGTCTDLVNGYSCECTEGWEGDTCTARVDHCPATCTDCTNGFYEAICRCEEGYYGDACEFKKNECVTGNPCQSPGGTCQVQETGDADCDCAIGYGGDECEVKLDPCAGETLCENGGSCYVTGTDEFECTCAFDFIGERCEQSVDQCRGVQCPNGGTCVDGIGEYCCRCPLGFTGPDCSKPIDPDFDYLVSPAAGTAGARSMIPFPLGSTALSLGAWVRFSRPGSEGAVLTLSGIDEQYLTSPTSRVMLRVTHEGVIVSVDRSVAPRLFPLGRYDINDGKWYYINVQLDTAGAGLLRITVNSVVIKTVDGYALGQALPAFGWIELGSADGSADGGAFSGEVSKVQVWSRALALTPDVASLAESRKNVVNAGLIVPWDDYTLLGGVSVQRPSDANGLPPRCAGGLPCTPLTDKEPPSLECPDVVVRQLRPGERLAEVSWPELALDAHDYSSFVTTIPNHVPLTAGAHYATAVAMDDAGNAATCSFCVFVRYSDCPAPSSPPLGGSHTCTAPTWPFRNCEPTCDDPNAAFSVPVPKFYTCGPMGTFNVHQPQLPFVYPACAPCSPARVSLRVSLVYPQIVACEEVQRLDALKLQVLKTLQAQNAQWGTTLTSPQGGLCPGDPDCEAVAISMLCAGPVTERRRKRSTADATVVVELPDLPNSLYNAGGIAQRPEDIFERAVLGLRVFDFEAKVEGAVVEEARFKVQATPVCAEGAALREDDDCCVECAPGTSWQRAGRTCVLCPKGSYQEEYGRSECKPCGVGKTTAQTGSQSADDCKESCYAGSYFDGTACVFCPENYFQAEDGMSHCEPCPAGTVTAGVGTKHASQCVAECPDGTQGSAAGGGGRCSECPQGTYRRRSFEDVCEACDPGYTTGGPGSRLEEDCRFPDCSAGNYQAFYVDEYGQETKDPDCQACPLGSYQPLKWQTACLPCPDGTTTTSLGADSVADCQHFCPEGFEHSAVGRYCQPCQVGTYKGNSDPGAVCESCELVRAGFVTPASGATHPDNCTVLACEAGEQPNSLRSACEPCPAGSYQPRAYQPECLPCQPGTFTRQPGSVYSSQCQEHCEDGQERSVAGDCVPCGVGYFRSVAVDGHFAPCQLCPLEFITAGTGSDELGDCSVANCSAGSRRSPFANACLLCAVGEYQHEMWQDECRTCPPGKTTVDRGSDSVNDCLMNCEPGTEDRYDRCEACQVGYYKERAGSTRCDKCEEGWTTAGEGAELQAECDVEYCEAGQFVVGKECEPCEIGTFSDQPMQPSCTRCPRDRRTNRERTTYGMASSSASDCVLVCPSGQEYDEARKDCRPCPIGMYRLKGEHDTCQLCPPETITDGPGAISVLQCTSANCSAGYFRDQMPGQKEKCEPCPKDTYQPSKWQIRCLRCPPGYGTLGEGAVSEAECIRMCPAGEELLHSTECRQCERDMYRPAEDTTGKCLPCPFNRIASQKGATSVAECSLPACNPGQYIDDNNDDCELCPVGYYQPDKWQTKCKLCPAGDYGTTVTSTNGLGATSARQCVASNDCDTRQDGSLPCAADSEKCKDIVGKDNYECVCNDAHVSHLGDGKPPCVHKCDADYCLNGATCQDLGMADEPSCLCAPDYEGQRCQAYIEPRNMTPFIIGGSVGGFLFLLLILGTVIWVCYCCKRSAPGTPLMKPTPPPSAMTMQPVMLHNPNTYSAVPPMVLAKPAPSLVNYPIVGEPTMEAYSTMGFTNQLAETQSVAFSQGQPEQQYVFYQDVDNEPVQPTFVTVADPNAAGDQFEEKMLVMDLL